MEKSIHFFAPLLFLFRQLNSSLRARVNNSRGYFFLQPHLARTRAPHFKRNSRKLLADKQSEIYLVAGVIIIGSIASVCGFELPSVISDGMVLQRDTTITLWGKASPKQSVTLTTSWGIRDTAIALTTGYWHRAMKTIGAGGPYEITFQTSDTLVTLRNILMGEVWLCSGQSNMEMPLQGWPPHDTILNSHNEIVNARFPQIRLFTVGQKTAMKPMFNCNGSWSECTPESVAGFSAIAYLFGKRVHQKLGVPVGLIQSSWSGTPAEAWTSVKSLKKLSGYKHIDDSLKHADTQFATMMAWMSTLEKTSSTVDATVLSILDSSARDIMSHDFSDTSWPVMLIPAYWENSALPGFDGIVWLRKTFVVPPSFENKECVLHLGPIDDMDRTYLNGKKIGEIMTPGFWNKPRVYTIPAGIVKAGSNTVSVCVIDWASGGGIYGPDDSTLNLSSSDTTIRLNGEWKYMPVAQSIHNELYLFTRDKPFSKKPVLSFPVGSNTPSVLFNGMISPLVPITLRGAIWYQGESNVGRGLAYRTLFPAMIECWRKEWNQGDFPFYYVQIAPWRYDDTPRSSPAAEVREAQLMTLRIPNTGMVVTMDIGNPVNIHPANKPEVARRLALWALAKTYGFDTIPYSGPLYKSVSVHGNKMIVSFDFADNGLVAKGGELTHFELAGKDQVFHPANALITGKNVVVASDNVPNPVAVRYAWSADAEPNLFNTAGLPASPFRSDTWK